MLMVHEMPLQHNMYASDPIVHALIETHPTDAGNLITNK